VSRSVSVADPLLDNPRFGSQYYQVPVERLIASIMLGIVTYDANLLVILPPGHPATPGGMTTGGKLPP
jgi:hypothetical protein